MDDRSDRRANLRDRFLVAAGWHGAERGLLAADASFRSYDRLVGPKGRAVLMNAPPPEENVAAFRRVQELLLQAGLSAPRCLAADDELGFLLLEDLGDMTYSRALAEGAAEEPLYRLATDLLIELHRRLPDAPLPPYDAAALEREILLLPDWYLPAVRDRATEEAARASYLEAWRPLWPILERVPRRPVLLDYHVDNLMVLEGRQGVAACGLLDFQDARMGPVSYDLVSLLQDARRDLSDGLEAAMIGRYLESFPALERDRLMDSYRVLGAQRAAKIIGIFTRLSRRDGKDGYLKHIPRCWRLLESNLGDPILEGVQTWFDHWIPGDQRRQPASCDNGGGLG